MIAERGRSVPWVLAMLDSSLEEIVARVVSGLLSLDDEDAAGRATDWLEFIAPEETKALPVEHLASLAGHSLEACQLLAVRILLRRQSSPAGLPEPLLMAAVSSEYASVYEALAGSFAAELDVIPAGYFRKMLESRYGHGQMLGCTRW